jgi:H+/Cl- antiporter ClcA
VGDAVEQLPGQPGRLSMTVLALTVAAWIRALAVGVALERPGASAPTGGLVAELAGRGWTMGA